MATELGKAYVQIMPSARGISGSIQSQLDPEASAAGQSAGNKIGSSLKIALVAATAAVGVAVGKIISSSISEGAKLQQSLGGIETLFKDSAGMVKNYANEAYRTVGLSANDYMENVTGFSASLLQSMGGDTKKAAKVANMAMVDMGDNANKMGTNMEDIQNAYGGFAKQNYTMLDNLKLGYGGTGDEMKRLLKDATKLTGVKYDINNLADVYTAINAIQQELDITGTTAKEANETFAGSFAAMGAAYQNVMGKLSINEDVSADLQALAQTVSIFLFQNFIPMVGNVLKALPGAIMTFAQEAAPLFLQAGKDFINNLRNGLEGGNLSFLLPIFDAITNAVSTFSQIISDVINNYVVPTLQNLMTWLSENQDVVSKFGVALGALAVGFGAFHLLTGILPIITTVVTAVKGLGAAFGMLKSISGILALIKLGFTTLVAAVGGPVILITAAIAALVAGFLYLWTTNEGFRDAVIEIWNSIVAFIQPIIAEIVGFVMEIWGGMVQWWNENNALIMQTIQTVWEAIKTIIAAALSFIVPILQVAWVGIQNTIQSVWNVIKSVISTAINLVKGIIKTVMQMITGDWSGAWQTIKSTVSNLIAGIKSIISNVLNLIVTVIKSQLNNAKATFSAVFSAVKTVVSIAFNAIKSTISNVLSAIISFIKNQLNNVKSTFSNIFNGLKSVVSSAFTAVTGAVKNGMTSAFNAVKGFLGKFKDAGKNIVTSIAEGITGAIGKVTDAIGNVAGKIRDFLPFSPPKTGPLTDIMDVKWGETIGGGIVKGEHEVAKAMDKILDFDLAQEASFNSYGGSGKNLLLEATLKQNQLLTRILEKDASITINKKDFVDVVSEENALNALGNYF